MAIGKIFKIKERYYVSANGYISPVERVYGLFSEGMYLKDFKSQKVFDIRKGHVLSMSSTNNMRDFRLLLNEKFYDQVHSPALLGPDGGVYYFKQRGYYRVMYRNKAPLFQFFGFYGQPVEISSDGVIYFIASSLYGSSLFGWTPEEGIYRVSPSDTILSAIKAGGNQFLVCEIGSDFYSYKIISAKKIPEKPIFYKYPFRKVLKSLSTLSNLTDMHHWQTDKAIKENSLDDKTEDQSYLQSLKELTTDSAVKTVTSATALGAEGLSALEHTTKKELSYSTYNSLWHIRFNGIDLGIFRDPITEFNGLVNMGFRDPMEYSHLKFTFQKAFLLPNWTFKSHYMNKAWRLTWDLQYIYKQGYENFFGARDYIYIHELSQGFSFPLFRAGYWQSSVAVTNAFSAVEFQKALSQQRWYFTTQPSWQIQYRRRYTKGFDFHRQFFLKTALHYHLKIAENLPNFLLKARSHYTFHWGWDFYTKPFVNYKTALKPKSIPFRYFDSLQAFDQPNLDFSLRKRVFEQTNNYLSTGMEVKKFITIPLYFARYPFSIEGVAPTVTGTHVQFMDNHQSAYRSFLEWTFGMDFLILFHHKVKVRLGLYAGFSHPVAPFSYPSRPKNKKKGRALSAGSITEGLNQLWDDSGQNWSAGLSLRSHF